MMLQKTLQTTATPPETVAELDKIFKNGALITDKDKAEEVQKNLDAIAKAYGYEGSTDEFLKIVYYGKSRPGDCADNAGKHVKEHDRR